MQYIEIEGGNGGVDLLEGLIIKAVGVPKRE